MQLGLVQLEQVVPAVVASRHDEVQLGQVRLEQVVPAEAAALLDREEALEQILHAVDHRLDELLVGGVDGGLLQLREQLARLAPQRLERETSSGSRRVRATRPDLH